MKVLNQAAVDYHLMNISKIRDSQQKVDSYLCKIHNDHLLDMGAYFGLKLSVVGGDKPAAILSVLLYNKIIN